MKHNIVMLGLALLLALPVSAATPLGNEIIALTTHAVVELIPNLKALPASDIRLQSTTDGRLLLRFSTTGWNNGQGPLELRASAGNTSNSQQSVYQRIYRDDGTYYDQLAGDFDWHATHNHFHFEGYATYTLHLLSAPATSARNGQKTTFCIMDTTRINTKLPGAPKKAIYNTCGASVQGMSVGWGDTYGYYLAGQEIDVTGLPNSDYQLKIVLDPNNKLLEQDESDNVSTVDIRIFNGTVSVIGGSTRGR